MMTEVDPFAGVSTFVTAARAGSFTEAAELLGLTKSAVGKSIARLEKRLGLQLFHRTTRKTRLTEDGEAYYATCAAAMDDLASTEDALTSRKQILSGRLHVDMPVSFGRTVLLPILASVARENPKLSLKLTFTDATSDIIEDDVDLAIRFGELRDSSHLVTRNLATQRRVICGSPTYLADRGIPKMIADLKDHRCIVGALKGPPLGWWITEHGETKRYSPPATHQFSDGDAMILAALAGLGLCQVPLFMARQHIEEGTLAIVLADNADVSVRISAVWPRQAHVNPRVRHVVDRLVEAASVGLLD